jgi:stage III sporulation protein AH
MVKMTETAELESAVETLLSAKGFDNSVVSINEDAVDVVVSRYTLSDAERAQIEDIVERKTGMEIAQIVITLMELAEE